MNLLLIIYFWHYIIILTKAFHFCTFSLSEEQDERLKTKGNESYIDFDDDDNGDIPVIPNLEEVQEEVCCCFQRSRRNGWR